MEPLYCSHGLPAVRFVVPELDPSDERLSWSDDCPDCAALLECDLTMMELKSVLDGE